MRGLNNAFPAAGADNVHRQFSLGPPLLLLREETLWKKSSKYIVCCNLTKVDARELKYNLRNILQLNSHIDEQ